MKELPEVPFEDQVKEDMKPITSTVAFAKPLMSKRNLKKFLSLGKYCHPKSTATTTNTEASPTQRTESEETQQRTVSKPDVTKSKSSTVTDSSFSERKTQLSREEMKSSTEPVHYFLHRIMSSSSYNEEDLPSFSSGGDHPSDPSAIVSEESLERPDLERASTIKMLISPVLPNSGLKC
ncbi:fibrous sheath-interacting protein 2-like isoform X2 [Herpailurus yagouaroundi]|uniref:fibrous sheath-interacting protein 2-like isoform X2 n=1 Tax=Herpailurus yagouaroundi TaxID=1608482 RepID=UPI001AD650ED|nr:fibrous sheath-interacting protein 2-like isoform X2 [Puma yagouaroundi]